MLEWECALEHPEQGAAEGAPLIARQIIRPTEHAFDDFAGGATDVEVNRKALGIWHLDRERGERARPSEPECERGGLLADLGHGRRLPQLTAA